LFRVHGSRFKVQGLRNATILYIPFFDRIYPPEAGKHDNQDIRKNKEIMPACHRSRSGEAGG
jgi:hypothetical protein